MSDMMKHATHNTELLEDRGSWILVKCHDCNKLIEVCDEPGDEYIKEY